MINKIHNELTFQTMVEATPNALILVNEEGKIAYVNYFAEVLFQYKKSEIVGKELTTLIPSKYKASHPEHFKKFFKNPQTRRMSENRKLNAVKKDGTEFPVEIGLNPIVTVEGVMALASVIDITEKEKANEQFRLAVDASPNAIVLVNIKGNITLVNKRTETLFGYTRDELIGNPVEALLPEKYKDNHHNLRDKYIKDPTARPMGVGRDLFAKRKDNTEFPVEIGLSPIDTLEGRKILVSIIDITERKKSQESLQIHTKRIDEKNKELEQFTYIASHDLQEPLNSIIGYIDLLKEKITDKLSESENRGVNNIRLASMRMKNLIEGLLDYARLGKKMKLKLVDCNKLVADVLEDINDLITKKKAIIKFSGLPTIMAYETELRLMFQNLIINAIKYSREGVAPTININVEENTKYWKFSVVDNGIGIEKDYLEQVFLIFQRLSPRGDYLGTGIGLAHARKIAELHLGEIWVESEINVGSTFYFTINKNLEIYNEE